MIRNLIGIFGLLLAASAAFAQSGAPVKQSGNITPNTVPWWITSGVVGSGVTAVDSPISSFGATGPICSNSARQVSGAWNSLCFQANTNSSATISLQNYGSAVPQNIVFVINGVSYPIPVGGGGVHTNYYVGPLGSDTSACISSALPCLTLQGAWNKIASANYGTGGATLNVLDATYTGGLIVDGTWQGAGPLAITGNCSTPASTLVNVTGANAIVVKNASVTISCLELRTADAYGQLVATESGTINFSAIRFGGTSGQHITAGPGGIVHAIGNYSIIGGGESHWHFYEGGVIDVAAKNSDNTPLVITCTGTPNFTSYFAGGAYYGTLYITTGATFSAGCAAVTGPKFLDHNSATIFSGGLGGAGLPGSTAGVIETFGVYDTTVSGNMQSSAGFFGIGPSGIVADRLLTVNSNTVAGPAPTLAGQFHFVGADAALAGGIVDAYGSAQLAYFVGRKAFGTAAAPTAVTGPEVSLSVGGASFDSSGAYGNNANINFASASSQTNTNHAGFIQFNTVPTGSTTLTLAARIQPSGAFAIGGTTDSGAGTLLLKPQTFASLTACGSTLEGAMASVTDSTTVTWGATITGGSTSHVGAYCNGTNWTVMSK